MKSISFKIYKLVLHYFRDVFGGEAMEDYVILEHSDKFDSIICSSLGDITCNGEKELVIGTYGKVNYFVVNIMFLIVSFFVDDTCI